MCVCFFFFLIRCQKPANPSGVEGAQEQVNAALLDYAPQQTTRSRQRSVFGQLLPASGDPGHQHAGRGVPAL